MSLLAIFCLSVCVGFTAGTSVAHIGNLLFDEYLEPWKKVLMITGLLGLFACSVVGFISI